MRAALLFPLALSLQETVFAAGHAAPAAKAACMSPTEVPAGGHRFERNGWSLVHLKGTPRQTGHQQLIGDRKTGEIAYLELGLKNTPL